MTFLKDFLHCCSACHTGVWELVQWIVAAQEGLKQKKTKQMIFFLQSLLVLLQ